MQQTLTLAQSQCRDAVDRFVERLRRLGIALTVQPQDNNRLTIAWDDSDQWEEEEDAPAEPSVLMQHYMRTLRLLATVPKEADIWLAHQGIADP